MAKLYFRYGAMGSGKSIDLLKVAYNYEERDGSDRHKVWNRYNNYKNWYE